MDEITIAYPILDDNEVINSIIYDNYKVDINYDLSKITLNISDTSTMDTYQTIINKSNISINKLYKLLLNALNKEPNYNISFIINNNTLLCNLSFNHDILDINERIELNKINSSITKEQMLIYKIKQLETKIEHLETKIEDLETVVIGYCNTKHHLLKIPTDIPYDTEVLDLTKYEDYTLYGGLIFNKLTNLQKIIITDMEFKLIISSALFFPTVKCIKIICKVNIFNHDFYSLIQFSCPNINNITFIIDINRTFGYSYEDYINTISKMNKDKIKFEIYAKHKHKNINDSIAGFSAAIKYPINIID